MRAYEHLADGDVSDFVPFHTYLWKIASRCNINCSYCYVYNSVDQSWRDQPKLMSRETALRAAFRMVEHLTAHSKTSCNIIFHGGEPLMGGLRHLSMILDVIRTTFADTGIAVSIGMQTNLLLMTEEIADFLVANRVSIGVSLDGPPRVNDRNRVDHQGRPTSAKLEAKLALICQPRYRDVFGGFLCVIDPWSDAAEVTKYLLSFNPIGVDFLLPLDNHDRLPIDKTNDRTSSAFGDWLIRCYETWISTPNTSKVRFFQSIINLLCGAPSLVEALGLNPVDLIVIETDGSIEGVDSLKTTFTGAAKLGFNVGRDGFDIVSRHAAVRSRQLGATSLAKTCQECDLVRICGGGYLPHRYSSDRSYQNPSIYCEDLKKIIGHIDRSVQTAVRPLVRKAAARAAANGFTSAEGMSGSHRSIIEVACATLSGRPDSTVLDLGCGSGLLLHAIAAKTQARPFGIEYEKRKASYAHRLFRNLGGAAWQGDIYSDERPWLDQPYSLVIVPATSFIEAPSEVSGWLLERLMRSAQELVIYAYDDDRQRFGSLETIAKTAGFEIAGAVVGQTAVRARLQAHPHVS
jgi:uncharacterized protein